MTILLASVLGLVSFLLAVQQASATTTVNLNCTLIVPAHPLTARGLATPYQLEATNPQMGRCHEANPAQSAFVQGAIIDPATGKIFVYNPLVTDEGTSPAAAPVVPQLPQNAIVGLWFGFNGMTLTLQGTQGSLQEGHCVNGLGDSLFGQFAYCNAVAFFATTNKTIARHKLAIPPLGIGLDKITCPSTRDFSVVDQDQSDNVTTTYLVLANGQTAQVTAANLARFTSASTVNPNVLINGSDERLVTLIDKALNCHPFMAPDLANKGLLTTALPLNELLAAAHQPSPVALVPAGNPMVLVNGQPNLQKLNLYRIGVDQSLVRSLGQASTVNYCKNLVRIGPPRLLFDAPLTKRQPTADPAVATNLFAFLAARFNTTWGPGGLNCMGLLHLASPIVLTLNAQGIATNATINGVTP
jgi:hypothetical protein